jgi:hypothetical protein
MTSTANYLELYESNVVKSGLVISIYIATKNDGPSAYLPLALFIIALISNERKMLILASFISIGFLVMTSIKRNNDGFYTGVILLVLLLITLVN